MPRSDDGRAGLGGPRRGNQVDVVAVGNAIVDVLAHTPEDVITQQALVKGTMRLVEADEAERLYAAMGPGTEMSGGAAANTAVGVALLGGTAHFVGKVADDQLGKVFTHDIRAVGVGFDVPPAGSGSTGRCLVMVTPDAQRTMSTSLGVAGDLGPEDLDEELLRSAEWVFLEGYFWDPPRARAALIESARVAAAVAFSLSDPLLVGRHHEEIWDFCEAHVDLLFGNEDEVLALGGTDDLAEAIGKVRQLCETVVVTRSEKGSLVASSDGDVEVPAAAVSDVVDTTGAGDLYAAGFLAGRCRGLDARGCARLGGEAAAAVIAQIGARPDSSVSPFSRQ
ncbi:MAG TPA: adenosine kinase [Acidimicrobiales bacterium]|nr:adenosine kinase [Acidimicrobiales bacterium]